MRLLAAGLAALFAAGAWAQQPAPPWETGRVDPAWARVAPRKTETLVRKQGESDTDAGKRLFRALHGLKAGEMLRIGPGVWSMTRKTSLQLEGTARAPIVVTALNPKDPPVITRPDAKQNVLNVGDSGPCRYLALRGLKFTGGSSLIRLYDCVEVWIDRCELYRGGNVGITANSHDASRVFITRNHLHHFEKGTAEGMYLGANHGKTTLSYSVVAYNHVHHCSGEQGDGIELKQGSYGNWVVGNHVHDCRYPCITVYGTAGKPFNLIERNLCYRSQDNCVQIQGEALVRANVIVSGKNAGFASRDHQGKTTGLRFVGNTVVSGGTAVKLANWNARGGMLLANNAIYSRDGPAVQVTGGMDGVTLAGNVRVGRLQGVDGKSFRKGKGLADFVKMTWDGKDTPDARLSRGSALRQPVSPYHDTTRALRLKVKGLLDLAGAKRRTALAGAMDPGARSATPTEARRRR